MLKEGRKIPAGFRLSAGNMNFVEETAGKLGITKTAALDLLLTVVRKEKDMLTVLIRKALEE